MPITFTPVPGLPDVRAGDDLVQLLLKALSRHQLELAPRDVVVFAQKIVSKSEDRMVDLRQVTPGAHAQKLAHVTGKDARLIEVILSETESVVRAVPNVLIVRHRLGFVMANAGIDRSNVGDGPFAEHVLLLPRNPDNSAQKLAQKLTLQVAMPIAVIISDSFGRAWRNGVVNVALGAAGLPSLVDRRGEADRYGRTLENTEVAFADAIAAGAALAMGEGAEGTPVVLVRGLSWNAPDNAASRLLRSREMDLFT
jgi:coenzyme F420-0:L-glutamate ligase / coenzyme F420-1:gamma-L-glutamate ligase